MAVSGRGERLVLGGHFRICPVIHTCSKCEAAWTQEPVWNATDPTWVGQGVQGSQK